MSPGAKSHESLCMHAVRRIMLTTCQYLQGCQDTCPRRGWWRSEHAHSKHLHTSKQIMFQQGWHATACA